MVPPPARPHLPAATDDSPFPAVLPVGIPVPPLASDHSPHSPHLPAQPWLNELRPLASKWSMLRLPL